MSAEVVAGMRKELSNEDGIREDEDIHVSVDVTKLVVVVGTRMLPSEDTELTEDSTVGGGTVALGVGDNVGTEKSALKLSSWLAPKTSCEAGIWNTLERSTACAYQK